MKIKLQLDGWPVAEPEDHGGGAKIQAGRAAEKLKPHVESTELTVTEEGATAYLPALDMIWTLDIEGTEIIK